MTLYIDGGEFSEICGIPPLSTDTLLVLHGWSKNNYIPPITDAFNPWSAKASFRNLIMPPAAGALCRYGDPFISGTNPVYHFEAGIGTSKLATDVKEFTVVSYQNVMT